MVASSAVFDHSILEQQVDSQYYDTIQRLFDDTL